MTTTIHRHHRRTRPLILALDLGKYKCVACVYPGAPATPPFTTSTTDREQLQKLFAKHQPAVVVIEACLLAGWVHDLCAELGLPCHVANTASEAWKFKHTKRKTDRDDALRLAQLYALGQLPTVAVPRQRRAPVARPDRRPPGAGRPPRGRAEPHPRPARSARACPPRGAKAWTELGLQGIDQLAQAPGRLRRRRSCGAGLFELALASTGVAQADRRGRGASSTSSAASARRCSCWRRFRGSGRARRRRWRLTCRTPSDSRPASRSAYAGLVPRQYQSGELDRRGRITRRGPALLRKLLVECAWCMLRYNGWARAVYARLSRGKARKKQALVALARKLLVRCWAMLRDGTDWREEVSAPAG